MQDTTYFQAIHSILSTLQIPVKETQTMRDMADLMDETTRRAVAAQEAEKAPQNDEP